MPIGGFANTPAARSIKIHVPTIAGPKNYSFDEASIYFILPHRTRACHSRSIVDDGDPAVLIALSAFIGGIAYFIWRLNYAVHTVRDIDRNTQGIQRHAHNAALDLFGSRLQRVQDPRLAATILMLQIVRTGSPVTAAEKTQIMELMDDPLRIGNIETILVRAWGYTEQKRIFSRVADELTPLLRTKLALDERVQLIEMLTKVANAYGEASELQVAALARFKSRLTMPDP